jgi:predicted nucleotide-binding protein
MQRAQLRISRKIAAELLAKDVAQGQPLVQQAGLIGDLSEYERWKPARQQWIELTARTLGHIYDDAVEADEFRSAASVLAGEEPWQVECKRESGSMRAAIDILISLQDQLEDAERAGERVDDAKPSTEPTVDPTPAQPPPVGSELAPASPVGSELASSPPTASAGLSPERTGQVFLVHGSDERWRQAVAGLLERAGPHEVTTFNEWPSGRGALVAQFEQQTAAPSFAVVLLTADDVGAPRLDSDQEPYFSARARQGVVFAMGVLVAALTPHRVCALYEDGVESPCDLDGIAYIRLDQAGTWRSKLLLQLRTAGFDYDLNKLAPVPH